MTFSIVRGDLPRMAVDAVVVPANTKLDICGGAGAAVARAAGSWRLRRACRRLGGCAVGGAVATPGFKLKARHIIHAVGPVWVDGAHGERDLLETTYLSALSLADTLKASSVALPLLSTGAHGYPVREAFEVAVEAVRRFLDGHEMDVVLVVTDKAPVKTGWLYDEVAAYVQATYQEPAQGYGFAMPAGKAAAQARTESMASYARETIEPEFEEREMSAAPAFGQASGSYGFDLGSASFSEKCDAALPEDDDYGLADVAAQEPESLELHNLSRLEKPSSIEDLLAHLDAPFSTTLLALIDARGMTDAEVYKRANISRQHFAKIRKSPDYRPTKKTVLALALALRLSLDETRDLLARAGFALSHSSKFDVIIEFFIKNRRYDIYDINEVLYAYDQPLLLD